MKRAWKGIKTVGKFIWTALTGLWGLYLFILSLGTILVFIGTIVYILFMTIKTLLFG